MNKILRISVSAAICASILILNLIGFKYFTVEAKNVDYSNEPSITIVGGAGAVEYKNDSTDKFSKASSNQVLFENDVIKTGEDTPDTFITFANGSIVRLNSLTSVQIKRSADKDYYLSLDSGEIWVNTIFAKNEFFVDFDEREVRSVDSVFNLKNDSSVNVIKGGVSLYDFKNKEFTFLSIGDNVSNEFLESDWVKTNLQRDSQDRDVYAQSLKERTQKSGSNYSDGLLTFHDYFTFNDKKLSGYYLSSISTLIEDAAYYLSVDNKGEAENSFVLALNHAKKLSNSDLYTLKSLLFEKFNKYKSLSLKDGNIRFICEKIKEFILIGPSSRLLTSDEKIHFIRSYLYDALSANTVKESNNLMSSYFGNLLKFVKSNKNNFAKYADEDNRIIYEAILSHPEFYIKSYLEMKSELEKALILVIADASRRAEKEVGIISEKFELLKRLKEFVVQDRIATKDAFDVANFLENDLKIYIVTLNENLRGQFIGELSKYSDFIAFLNDQRYESPVYGSNAGERFISYINAKRENSQLDSLKKSISGNEDNISESAESINDVKKNVEKKFELYSVKIEEFGDVSGKYVFIKKAVLNGIPFSAKYDVDFDIISNIISDDKEFVFGVKPEKLNVVLSLNDSSDKSLIDQSVNVDKAKTSKAEEDAKMLVVNKLKDSGIAVSVSQVSVVNLLEKSFIVSNVEINDKKQKIFVNFDFKDPFTEASNIEVKTVNGVMPLGEDKKTLLSSLAPTVIEFYDKAFYDKVDKFVEEQKK